jgi:hypothetical protein
MVKKQKTSVKKVQVRTNTSAKKAESKSKTKAKAPVAGKATRTSTTDKVRVVNRISPPRALTKPDLRKSSRNARSSQQYSYMKAPGIIYDFQVGDRVEVFCDHEKGRERVRGWLAGIVVQVDNKMVAVQFRSNVFLTDGWMVPDRILWYPLNSEHIRPDSAGKKIARKAEAIPNY